jgi:hypothetical protein
MEPDYVNNSENGSPPPSVIVFWVRHRVDEGLASLETNAAVSPPYNNSNPSLS